MKNWKHINKLIWITSFIFLLNVLCEAQEKSDFEPSLQQALDTVIAQRNETESALMFVKRI